MTDAPMPWESNRHRHMEALLAEEVPDISWSVRALLGGIWNPFPQRRWMIIADSTARRVVGELTPDEIRRIAHEMALIVRLRANG